MFALFPPLPELEKRHGVCKTRYTFTAPSKPYNTKARFKKPWRPLVVVMSSSIISKIARIPCSSAVNKTKLIMWGSSQYIVSAEDEAEGSMSAATRGESSPKKLSCRGSWWEEAKLRQWGKFLQAGQQDLSSLYGEGWPWDPASRYHRYRGEQGVGDSIMKHNCQ